MPPNSETAMEKDINNIENKKPPLLGPRKYRIAYRPVITFTYIHVAAIYGIYLCFTKAKWATVMLLPILLMIGELGITAGAHRLWAHRSYKAKMPLQIILMIFNSLAFQNTAIYWVRDHRQHHKYSDTDGDPHNSRRGFFYSHIGWLLTKKPAEVIECGKTIDMSDLYNNPVLRFQKKYALPLIAGICFIMPTVLPVYFWGETYSVAWHLNMLRYALTLNITFLVNSAAHMWGYRPYDMAIKPVQNLLVSLLSLGEGFHNYHHVFPWDYQTAELGNSKLNLTKWFIDFFAWVGWAYDLKTVPDDIVKKRGERTGDGTDLWGSHDEVSIEDYEKAYAKFDS